MKIHTFCRFFECSIVNLWCARHFQEREGGCVRIESCYLSILSYLSTWETVSKLGLPSCYGEPWACPIRTSEVPTHLGWWFQTLPMGAPCFTPIMFHMKSIWNGWIPTPFHGIHMDCFLAGNPAIFSFHTHMESMEFPMNLNCKSMYYSIRIPWSSPHGISWETRSWTMTNGVIVCCHQTDTTWWQTTEQQQCNVMMAQTTTTMKRWPQDNNNPTTHQWQQQPTNSELTQSFTPPFPYSHAVQVTCCQQRCGNQTTLLLFVVVVYSMTQQWAALSQLHPNLPT